MGLYGSRAYAAKAKAAGEDIVAALNADMIGS
jgi:Zn-dependent M28 family amino/carboxypeptidase